MDITGNPLIILASDVVGVAVIVWTGNIHIWEISFSEYSSASNSCELTRTNGKELWFGQGAADLETVRSGHLGNVNGIKIPANGITGGVVRIYHKS